MANNDLEKKVIRWSTLSYLAFSLIMATVFLLLTFLFGAYPLVARVGGAVWTFFLSLIISMPWTTSYFQRRLR